jgi:hypothetical protein
VTGRLVSRNSSEYSDCATSYRGVKLSTQPHVTSTSRTRTAVRPRVHMPLRHTALLVHGLTALCSVLLTKYYSGDQIEKTEMGRACSTYGRGEYRVLVGKLAGKRRRWEKNIKMDLRGVG